MKERLDIILVKRNLGSIEGFIWLGFTRQKVTNSIRKISVGVIICPPQAGAAAVKAIGLLAKDKLMTNPCTAKPDELLCNGCSTCANVCPYGAISYIDKEVNDHGIREVRRIAQVNSALCQGCGACTVACPSGSMDLQGFSNRQILAEVDAICR